MSENRDERGCLFVVAMIFPDAGFGGDELFDVGRLCMAAIVVCIFNFIRSFTSTL